MAGIRPVSPWLVEGEASVSRSRRPFNDRRLLLRLPLRSAITNDEAAFRRLTESFSAIPFNSGESSLNGMLQAAVISLFDNYVNSQKSGNTTP